MRPRKERLPLTRDSLTALMIPGTTYTAAKLACIFDASPAAIAEILITLAASGVVHTCNPICGRVRDMRDARRVYWIPAYIRTDIAMRRVGPAEVCGELKGYDLSSFQRLAMTSRR